MKFARFGFALAGMLLLQALRADVPQLVVKQPIPAQTVAVPASFSLEAYLGYAGVAGQIVQFDTNFGAFNVELLASAAPNTVANFLRYVNRGYYTDTIIHQSTNLNSSGLNRIIQGGAYTYNDPPMLLTDRDPAVDLEYNLPNTRGTIALFHDPQGINGTSEYFFNVDDNTTLRDTSHNSGYTVFGRVIGGGMSVVDAIAQLRTYDLGVGLAELPLHDVQANQTSIYVQNLVRVKTIKPISLYPTTGGAAAVLQFSASSANPTLLNAAVSGSTLTLTPGSGSGTTTVTVTASDASGASVQTTFNVMVGPIAPVITAQPLSQTVPTGMPVVLRVAATGQPLTFQWKKDGTDIAGATTSTLLASGAGSYTVAVANGAGTVTSDAAVITTVNSTNPGRLVNLSIRTDAGTGTKTLIVGFVVAGGSDDKPLLLRALGPTLGGLGVANFLPDPSLEVIPSSGGQGASNDNWSGAADVSAVGSEVGAYPLASPISKDAALVFTTKAGVFTAKVLGAGTTSGVALAEIYDATSVASISATTPRLTNVSARAQVGTGEHILIAGFVVSGDTSRTLLIRGVGPSLVAAGVSDALTDPQLTLFSSAGAALASNDNWDGEITIKNVAATIGASPLASDGSKDAALLVTLQPGVYTAQVSGVGGTTGVALAEVYEVTQ